MLQRAYNLLVVSASEKFSSLLELLFSQASFASFCSVQSIAAAKRQMADRSFDMVLINSPLADGTGERFAIDTAEQTNCSVLFLVKQENYGELNERLAAHGVFLMPKPVNRASMLQAMDWMIAARERLRRYEKQTLSVEEKMKEIRLVNRAKWLLISALKMTEPEAHRYIEKRAMDSCVSRAEIAETIIKTYN